MRRASRSREAGMVSLMTSFAITGTATGRRIMGSRTQTAITTQLFRSPFSQVRRPNRHETTMLPRLVSPAS
jgi:hypothetical protein